MVIKVLKLQVEFDASPAGAKQTEDDTCGSDTRSSASYDISYADHSVVGGSMAWLTISSRKSTGFFSREIVYVVTNY